MSTHTHTHTAHTHTHTHTHTLTGQKRIKDAKELVLECHASLTSLQSSYYDSAEDVSFDIQFSSLRDLMVHLDNCSKVNKTVLVVKTVVAAKTAVVKTVVVATTKTAPRQLLKGKQQSSLSL